MCLPGGRQWAWNARPVQSVEAVERPLYQEIRDGSPLTRAQFQGKSVCFALTLLCVCVQFVTNKYGEVKHYYSPLVESSVIEADIKRLLQEDFDEQAFSKLLNPPAEAFN